MKYEDPNDKYLNEVLDEDTLDNENRLRQFEQLTDAIVETMNAATVSLNEDDESKDAPELFANEVTNAAIVAVVKYINVTAYDAYDTYDDTADTLIKAVRLAAGRNLKSIIVPA